jgi:hypothetical protein
MPTKRSDALLQPGAASEADQGDQGTRSRTACLAAAAASTVVAIVLAETAALDGEVPGDRDRARPSRTAGGTRP